MLVVDGGNRVEERPITTSAQVGQLLAVESGLKAGETVSAIGTTVWGGMIVATFGGILFIPPLYVAFQTMRERTKARRSRKRTPGPARSKHPAEQGAGNISASPAFTPPA